MRIPTRIMLFIACGGLLIMMAVSTVSSARQNPNLTPTPLQAIPSPIFLTTLPVAPTRAPVSATDAPLLTLPPLKLTGHLVYTEDQTAIRQLDMATGAFSTLFQSPDGAYVLSAAVSPDNSLIAMAYQPPPPTSTPNAIPQYGYTNIYLLPRDGKGQPQLFLKGASDQDILILPFWLHDGKSLYYIHYHADQDSYDLERVAYPNTQPQTVVKQILYAALSPDGTKIAYLQQDVTTYQYSLFLADASGANRLRLIDSTVFFTMDVVTFNPDGKALTFSAAGQPKAFSKRVGPVWVTDWFGKGVAMDGNVPSDLWQVSVQGGAPRRVTNLNELSLYPAFSPDGKHLALLAVGGIYIMNPDGSKLVRLTDAGTVGTLDWTP